MISFAHIDAIYAARLSDMPLSIVQDYHGEEYTWVEARTHALAVRGRLRGLGTVPVWSEDRWRPTMALAFGKPRRRFTRVLDRDALVRWAGEPWWPPESPCPHCHGTGRRGGTSGDMGRPGALTRGVLVDRNLIAKLLPAFPSGALVLDARPDVETDPVRLRSPGRDVVAVLARVRGSTGALEPFDEWARSEAAGLVLPGADGPWMPEPVEVEERDGAVSLDRLDTMHDVEAIDGPGDLYCKSCGGVVRTGQCTRCGKVGR